MAKNYLRNKYSGFFDAEGMACLTAATDDAHT